MLAQKLHNYNDINFIPSPTYPLVQDQFSGDRFYFSITSDLYNNIKELARIHNVSIFNVFLAAYNIFIGKYTRAQDIVIGVPFSGRVHDPQSSAIGYYANMMPIRTLIEKQQKFSDFLQLVHQNLLFTFTKQEVELEDMLSHLDVSRKSVGQHPLIRVSLNWIPNSIMITPYFKGIEAQIEQRYFPKTAKFDLSLFLFEEASSVITCYFEYKTSLFDLPIIQQFSEGFSSLLNNIIESPNESIANLRLLDATKEEQLAHDFFLHRDSKTIPDNALTKSLGELFDDIARRYSANCALLFKDYVYTYQEVLEKAEFWAYYIRSKYENIYDEPMPEGILITLCVPRHPDMIFAILGVLKAGGTYIPVDPTFPRERIEYIINDSKAALFITHKNCYPANLNISQELVIFMDDNLEVDIEQNKTSSSLFSKNTSRSISTNTAAYIIYTSGSTGKPKGVIITHANVLSLFRSIQKKCTFSQNDVWSLFHTYCFDVSVWEIWGAFLFGGGLVIVPQEETRDQEKLHLLLKTKKVTVLTQTPLAFQMIINQDILTDEKLALRYIFFAGESLKLSTLKLWIDKYSVENPMLINMYGATEATIHTTYSKIEIENIKRGRDNIGKALEEFRICIMDDAMRFCPVGLVGEICIGGSGLATAYLNKPELTKEKFVVIDIYQILYDAKSEVLLYRTGDLGRWMPDGSIEYVGRKDFQVKLRGFRIELGEIESAISSFDFVTQALVLLKGSGENAYLVAYYTIKPGHEVNINHLKQHLRLLLPEYMIPQQLVQLDHFPITINGKIDRKTLYQTEDHYAVSTETLPLTHQKQIDIAQVWSEVLNININSIGRNSNFFTLGGNSLLVVKMLALVKKRLGYALSINKFMAEPTISSLENDSIYLKDDANRLQQFIDKLKKREKLDTSIFPLDAVNTKLLSPNIVLLTGATGFLGAHILNQLLSTNVSKIYCLVRDISALKGFERICHKMKKYGLLDPLQNDRMSMVIPIIGDLAQKQMGISSKQFDEMSNEVDGIFHVAAHVNHILDFEALYKENVQSTLEIIKFATTNKNKAIHFVSTLAAGLLELCASQNKEFRFLQSGYVSTKFVSEYLLRQASERGIAAYIYRPGNIIGGENGICEPENNTTLLRLKGLLQLKKAYIEEHEIFEMMPVDVLSKAIVDLSREPKRFAYNLHNTKHLSWRDYISFAKDYGFDIDFIQNKEDWENIIDQLGEENALYRILWFYNIKQPQLIEVEADHLISTKSYKDLSFKQFDALCQMGFFNKNFE
jgi:amino acid adenylation domain-containing protein/thioester reductase-like protein